MNGVWASTLRSLLRVASIGYGGVAAARNMLFDLGIKRTHRASVPVISVGNLTTGGTGKTPVVAWVVNWLTGRGFRVAILSRGYRAIANDDASGEATNDEKLVLEQLCPGVPHVQNPDRVAGARTCVERHAAQVIVLDDGFQHRRLGRELDVVLLDATNPFGYGAVLPRGLLRESVRGLRRASVVAVTRCDQVTADDAERIARKVRGIVPGSEPIAISFPPNSALTPDGDETSLHEYRHKRVGAFCGIGNPDGFLGTLKSVGITPEWFRPYPDHHHYSRDDIESIADETGGCDVLLTTLKDMVKLRRVSADELLVRAVMIAAQIDAGQSHLTAALEEIAKVIE